MLCQKLGGPKPPSPARPPLSKAASSSQVPLQPGESIQRQSLRKPRRTLERVLTDEKKASQARPTSLSRSATDSILPGLKREITDLSLSSIPLNKVIVHQSKRYSQREVDLGATCHVNEAKIKKKANVEKELKDAIATLKKPNSRLAVKDIVEAAEKRVAASQLPSKHILESRKVLAYHKQSLSSLEEALLLKVYKSLQLLKETGARMYLVVFRSRFTHPHRRCPSLMKSPLPAWVEQFHARPTRRQEFAASISGPPLSKRLLAVHRS